VGSIAEFESGFVPGRHIIAILDLGLPDGDGMDVIASLRRDNLRLGIIVLTARMAMRKASSGASRKCWCLRCFPAGCRYRNAAPGSSGGCSGSCSRLPLSALPMLLSRRLSLVDVKRRGCHLWRRIQGDSGCSRLPTTPKRARARPFSWFFSPQGKGLAVSEAPICRHAITRSQEDQ